MKPRRLNLFPSGQQFVALEIPRVALPTYRSQFSKRRFTRPRRLAILCVMRYEDWTFRETKACLAEHRELRRARKLKAVPDHTTLYRFMRRLNDELLQAALSQAVDRVLLQGPTDKAIGRAR